MLGYFSLKISHRQIKTYIINRIIDTIQTKRHTKIGIRKEITMYSKKKKIKKITELLEDLTYTDVLAIYVAICKMKKVNG